MHGQFIEPARAHVSQPLARRPSPEALGHRLKHEAEDVMLTVTLENHVEEY